MRIKNLNLKLGKKLGLPDNILTKPSALTAEEWNFMKTLLSIGYGIAKSTPELSNICYQG